MEYKELDWPNVLKKIASYSTCSQSNESLLETTPYSHMALAQKNMDFIKSCQNMLLDHERKRVRLDSFENIRSILYSVKKAQVLNIQDLNQTRLFFEDIKALLNFYKWDDYEALTALRVRMISPEPFLSYIDQLITENGEFRSDASPFLFESFNKKKKLSQEIHKTLDRLVKDFSLEKVLQDKYVTTREGRWVLPIISGKQHDFKGLVHDASNTKQTVYMEPEAVIGLNNKVRELEEAIKREIDRLLKEVSYFLHDKINEIIKTYEAAIEADKLLSCAHWSIDFKADCIQLKSQSQLDLKEVFHPLLIEDFKDSLVTNDFKLEGSERILLLSGPNAGGKTVLLKGVGLACHMARCGLPVCAKPDSQIPFFKNISVLVGDHQSVEDSLSTFAAHLKTLDDCTELKGLSNLILIDEICGSTEAGEGSALARAFIEIFAQNKVMGFITSHLDPLKKGWDEDSGVVNGSMNFDQQKGSPTFEFIKGVPGDSLALETARKVGVSEKIVDRALFFLSPEQKKKYSGLIEIESLQEILKKQKKDYQAKQKEVEDLKKEYQSMIRDFKKEQDELMEKSIKNLKSNLESQSNYSQIQSIMKNQIHLDKMRKASPNLINTAKESAHIELTQENFNKKLPPGTQVYVPSLKKKGVVQGTPNSQGFVPIMSESMRLMIKWSDIRAMGQKPDSNEKSKKPNKTLNKVLEEKVEIDVDLRGMSVEDALEELENNIDRALQLNCERIKVIHGHGTEKVKKAVRSFLSRHPHIKTWKSDSGDGATLGLF